MAACPDDAAHKINEATTMYIIKVKERIHKIIDNIEKKEYVDILMVVFFAIVIYTYTAITCIPRAFTDDDWGIANYFAGAMGAEYATPYNKFINFIWGWIMYIMYQFMPGPNWFIVIQEIIVVLSFAILQYMLIQKMKEHLPVVWCYLLTSALLMAFEPSYICRLEFTQTAALGSIIGVFLIMFSHSKKWRAGYIGGIALTVISALHRFGAFEMCLPFAALVMVDHVLYGSDEITVRAVAKSVFKDKKLYLTIAGIILCCFMASKINTSIYNSDYYAEYNAFNSARASLLDHPRAPYEDIAGELEAIGVSENDYMLITSWTFADLSFVTTDLLRSIAALQPKESDRIDYGAEINKYFANLKDLGIVYNKLFYMALIILCICLILDFKHMIWYAPLLLAGTLIMEMYFSIIVKRYPSYVRTGLLFILIVTALKLTDFSKIKVLQGRKAVTVITSFLIFFSLYSLGNEYYLMTKGTFEYNMDGLAMYEYMNSREDDIFMIPTGEAGGLPVLRNSYSIFQETKPGIMKHTVGWGGWSTNNPWVNEAYHSWGIDYPMSQAADDNVYLLAAIGKVDSIRTYLMEHRKMDTSASLSAIEYGTTIYKLTDKGLELEKDRGTGIVNSVECTYDSTYETYDILLEFSIDAADISEDNRIFMTMLDETGDMKYFMVFNGNNMSLSTENDVVVKVPVSFINDNMEYAINIMVQRDGVNRLLCADNVCFSLEDHQI